MDAPAPPKSILPTGHLAVCYARAQTISTKAKTQSPENEVREGLPGSRTWRGRSVGSMFVAWALEGRNNRPHDRHCGSF
ncbi:hypothetical protein VTO73DRAFT_15459 [Trametes versicolor]